jgi:hypothetical protein
MLRCLCLCLCLCLCSLGPDSPRLPAAVVVTSSACTFTPPQPLSSLLLSRFLYITAALHLHPIHSVRAHFKPPAHLSCCRIVARCARSTSPDTPDSSAKRSGTLETLVRLNCSTSPSHHQRTAPEPPHSIYFIHASTALHEASSVTSPSELKLKPEPRNSSLE